VTDQFQILVVCLGNVCRSPLAEHLLRMRFEQMLGDGASAVRVSSAGVRALVGDPMNECSAAELRRLGGDPDGFVSSQVTIARATEADLVLTATRDLRSRVLEEAPRALKRTFTIREFAALASDGPARRQVSGATDLVAQAASARGSAQILEYDVPDPIGKSAEVHHEVAEMLDADCAAVARAVVGAILSDVSPR
jgi:low molecular weight protein-tyrosine phosphatase